MLEKVERFVNRIEDGLILTLIMVIVVSVFLQVFFRYVLQAPLSWTEELARSCLIWLTFIGSALAIRAKGHFALEIVTARLPGKTRIFWELTLMMITAVFLIVMIYNGIIMLPMLSLQVSASLQIPMSYIYLVISIGSSFMLFHVAVIFWKKMGEIFIRRLADHS